jgi:hypothetical protein
MEGWQIIVLLLVVLAIGVGAWAFTRRRHTQDLQSRFGPEYEHTVQQTHDRRAAERELDDRRKRVEGMELRALDPDKRDEYIGAWKEIQAEFVDDPAGATTKADRLIEDVMAARGYPTGTDFERRAADISVNHPRVVSEYRSAREIAERHAAEGLPTEMLRRGFVHYRALFEDLLETESTTDQREPVEARSR